MRRFRHSSRSQRWRTASARSKARLDMGTLLVMAAENHSTEEVELVRGDDVCGGRIDRREIPRLAREDKQTKPNPRTDLKIRPSKTRKHPPQPHNPTPARP